MSEFAVNLPRKFISFRHLGVESSAHKVSEERESEDPQNVAGMEEANTVEIGKTSTSPPKGSSSLQNVPMRAESTGAELGVEDRNLTMAEKHCALTSSDDHVEYLSAFVAERLQCLIEGSVEKLIGEECVNVEEILFESVGIGDDSCGNGQSVCPNVTPGRIFDVADRRSSSGMEINEILREELGSATVTSTPKRVAWPIYSKRRSSVLKEPGEPVCKAVVFDVACGSGTVGGVELSREGVTDTCEGVPESFLTSCGFSTSEGIAQRQADERFVGTRLGDEGEGVVRVPPVDETFGQKATTKERTRYYPSQSAKSLLKSILS